MSELKPALSAEEWKVKDKRLSGETYVVRDAYGDLTVRYDHEMFAIVPSELEHALAALALYGQPFGFTWEDVETLRAVIAEFPMRDEAEADELGSRLHALANRIAALLPPDPQESQR